MRRSARALLLPAASTAVLFAALVSLGVWQLQRLHEKEALIARIEARAQAAPQELPPLAQWTALEPDDYEFRRVRAMGRYLPGHDALIFANPPQGLGREPGYLVLTPFGLAGGGAILVVRGFVPDSKASDVALRAPPEGETVIAGLLRAPQGRSIFTPKDEPARGVFYTRDPVAISVALALTDAAPFTLTLEAAPNAAADWPRPVPGAPEVTNNHLTYALTWFSLALAIIIVFGLYARGVLRSAPKT